MPRKKVDQVQTLLDFFKDSELAVAKTVLQLARNIVSGRETPVAVSKPVRKRVQRVKPVREIPVPPPMPPPPVEHVAKPVRRRLRKPVNEATPIVPPQETVGDDAGDEAYSGN